MCIVSQTLVVIIHKASECMRRVQEETVVGIRFDGERWWQSRGDCRWLPFLAHWQTWMPGNTLRALESWGSRWALGLPWSLWSIQSSRRCWTCRLPAVRIRYSAQRSNITTNLSAPRLWKWKLLPITDLYRPNKTPYLTINFIRFELWKKHLSININERLHSSSKIARSLLIME